MASLDQTASISGDLGLVPGLWQENCVGELCASGGGESRALALTRPEPLKPIEAESLAERPNKSAMDFQIGVYEGSCLEIVPCLNYASAEGLFGALARDYDLIETGPLNNGREDVPRQSNSWSCGINGAARMLAMLGQPLPDYSKFHDQSPNHPVWHTETGPGTLRLSRYMQKQNCCKNEFGEVFVGPNMTDTWEPQEKLIFESLHLSRPILVLIEESSRNFRWVNIVGRHKRRENFLALNSYPVFMASY